jgi:hypothetical protein
MKRKTSRKKFRAKLLAVEKWLKESRTLPTQDLMKTAVAKLRDHFEYYGVTDNWNGISRFSHKFRKLLSFKWLNRCGKRGCMSSKKFEKLINKYPLPRPRIMVSLFAAR